VAAEAGVALQTVFTRGSKSALLLAAVDRAVAGDDADEAFIERADIRELLSSTDGAAKLAMLREATVTYTQSAAPVLRVFRGAAADPEIAEAWAEYERRRYADMRVMVGSSGGFLRDGLDADRAAAIS
jgi:hypothetical protein